MRPTTNHWSRRGQTPEARGLQHGYRSGLEKKNADLLESLGVAVLFETFKVPYIIPATTHHYTVDFELPNGILVETKGRWLTADRAKHLFVRTQYPELDIRLVFDSAKTKIGPGSNTTVTQWADKHGFTWAIKTIPPEWTREAGPARKPRDVLKDGPLGFQEFLKKEKKQR